MLAPKPVSPLPTHVFDVRRTLAERLRRAIERKRTTLTAVSDFAAVDRGSLSAMLAMKQSIGLDKLDRIAEVVEVDTSWLLNPMECPPPAHIARA